MKRPLPVRSPATTVRHTEVCRPLVETLEERLPPGDVLLAKIWGASWFGANVSEMRIARTGVPPATSVRWSAPESHSSPVALIQRPTPEKTLNRSTESLFPPTATTPIGMDDGLDPFGATDALSNPGGSHGAAPARHFVSPQVAMSHAVEDGATAAPVGAPSTPAPASSMSQPAATEASHSQPANDLNYFIASTLTVPSGNATDGPGDYGPGAPPPSGRVHALFQLDTTTGGPFPADRFTAADRTQNTDRRVNLPYPDCSVYVSDCQDIAVLNELDGFNLQPRLSIPFDGTIDVNSVNSQSMFLVSLGDTLNHHDHGGQVVGINQVVWDTFTNSLHVESDQLLDQHTRYALIVTSSIHDQQGHPVEASREFLHFRHDLSHSHDPVLRFYGQELEDAVRAARRVGVRERDIVDAGVFTTESATAVLEKIRDQIHAATPAPADFILGQNGERTVFNRADVTGIHWEVQTGDDPPSFTPTDLNLSLLDVIPGTVGEIAFGKYLSPDYEIHPGEYIPPVGTRTGTPEVQGYNEVYFNLFLPSGPKPEGGWPVAIFGFGNGGSKNASTLPVVATMAAHGLATISINTVGHGFGPLGTLTVNQTVGDAVTLPAGGRGIDQDGDHGIGNNEGVAATPPRAIISRRDGSQQTAVDLMQLVREIQVGMDAHGDGTAHLDPTRVYFFSQSFGGSFGAPFLAVEPSVGVGVLNAVGGGWVEKGGRLSTGNQRTTIGSALAARVPSLLNSPGIAILDGVPIAGPRFNENIPLRDGLPLPVSLEDGTSYDIQSPVINTVPGAMAIQEESENQQWVTQAGNPLAYAAHLRKEPLEGVPAKAVIIQFNKGDMTANNPMTTAIVRAGGLTDQATFYRNDLAFAEDPNVPKDPHTILNSTGSADPLVVAIARGYQEQIATFFETDGQEIIHPEPARFFETPIQEPLPEDLNFIP